VTYLHLTLTAALLLFSTSAALSADAPAQVKGPDGKLSNPLAAQSIERLSAIVDRPLFSPNRRGVPTPPVNRAPETGTSPPPPNLVFSGAVLDGTSAHVVVLVGAERRALRAQIGDEIGGWKVSEISGRTLVLSRDGRFATFSLFKGNIDQRTSDDGAPSKGSANAPKRLP
jgi:general secretion pathway protein N